MRIKIVRPECNPKAIDAWYTRKVFHGIKLDVVLEFKAGNKYFRLQDSPHNDLVFLKNYDHLSNRARMIYNGKTMNQLCVDETWCTIESVANNKEIANMLLRKDEVIMCV